MSHTVIGIFQNTNEAQEAKAYLEANGFNSGDVDIANGSSVYNNTGDSGHEEGFGNKISSFFSNLFEDEDDASSHTEAARKGVTVTVHTQGEEQTLQAVKILDNFGAVDVNEFSGKAKTSDKATGAIPVIKEELQVGKREIETGGVRLRSRIVERPVEESIRLREEHVSVERTPVNRAATEADFTSFKEGTIEEIEHAEKPVVAKEARVVEEVSLGKEVSEREETINDTVRHTEVDTEKIPGTEKTYHDKTDEDKF